MISFPKKRTARKSIQDIVALDFGASGLKVLHCKRLNDVTTVVAADILSMVELELGAEDPKPTNLNLAKPLLSNYAAVTYTGERSLIRVINVPGQSEDPAEMEKTLREHIGLDNSYRVAHLASAESKSKDNRFWRLRYRNRMSKRCWHRWASRHRRLTASNSPAWRR